MTDPVGNVDAFSASGLRRSGHTYTTGNEITTAPVASGHTIYFGDPNGYVTALNPATLERKWEWTTPQTPGTPQVSDGIVVTACGGQLVALWASDGKHLWSHGGVELGTPCIYDGVIYAYGGSDLYAIGLHSGRKLWQRQVWEAGSGHYLHPFARAGIVCSYVDCTGDQGELQPGLLLRGGRHRGGQVANLAAGRLCLRPQRDDTNVGTVSGIPY